MIDVICGVSPFERLRLQLKPVSRKLFLIFFPDGQDDNPLQRVANDARNSVVDRDRTLHVSLRLMVIYSARRACRII